MRDPRTAVVRASVLPSEHTAWQAKVAAAGDSADADMDRRCGRGRARAHAADHLHRQQPEPARALGERQRLGGRRRHGDLQPRVVRAVAARSKPCRQARRRCTLTASGAATVLPARSRVSRRRTGRGRALARGRRSPPRERGHGGRGRRFAGVRAQVHVGRYRVLRRPQFSWTRIKGASDVTGGRGHGRVEAQRREHRLLGGTDNGVLGRASVGW